MNNGIFRKSAIIDILIILLIAVGVFIYASNVDLFELMVDFSRAHEEWELDEIIPVTFFLALAMIYFTVRRFNETRRSEMLLQQRNRELHDAMEEINQLKGIIPICASCKMIRDDEGYWHQVEVYVKQHSNAVFSHGLCPDCAEKIYPDSYKKRKEKEE